MDTKADICQVPNTIEDSVCLTETDPNLSVSTKNVKEATDCVPTTTGADNSSTEGCIVTNDVLTSDNSEFAQEITETTEGDNIVRTEEHLHVESQVAVNDKENLHEDSSMHVSSVTEYNLSTGEINCTSDVVATYNVMTEENDTSITAISEATLPESDQLVQNMVCEIPVDGVVTETVEGNEELIIQEVEEVVAGETDSSDLNISSATVDEQVTEETYVIENHERFDEEPKSEECVIKEEEEQEVSHHIIENTEVQVSEVTLQDDSVPSLSSQDSIEQQLSQIVEGEDELQQISPSAGTQQQQSAISIAEAISRDFDESDEAEDPHQEPQLVVAEHDPHVIEQVVDITDRLGHGPVTVTDNSGQVYYVESVEEVIVVENNGTITSHQVQNTSNQMEMDNPDDDDVCVREYDKNTRIPEIPPIPSHMLGRNLDNPVEDTFRNGKVPPKPRLGVKVPYKNLTSQIVSKDEIAREILERQRHKQGGNKSPANVLFTKKLTQRLAKKIAPTTSTTLPEKVIQDNSDLIAILEGKDDQPTTLRSSKRNLTSHVQEEQIVVIDKDLEREIALKQLSELPRRGRGRRRQKPASTIENVIIPPRIKTKSETKKEELKDAEKKMIEKNVNETILPTIDDNVNFHQNKAKDDEMIQEVTIDDSPKKIKVEEKVELSKRIEDQAVDKINEKGVEPIKDENKVDSKKSEQKKIDTNKNEEKNSETETLDEKKIYGKATQEVVTDKNKKIDIKSIEVAKTIDIPTAAEKGTIDLEAKPISVPKSQSTTAIKTYERKRKSTEELVVSEKKIIRDTPPTAYVTKSSRVIKKKVIWDPDEPSTAKYLAEKVTSPQKPIKSTEDKKLPARTLTKDTVKKEVPEKSIKKDPVVERVQKAKTPEKKTEKNPDTPSKVKKRLTEIDKLLMDEGAVNMLYSVKNEEDSRKSLDKIQKNLQNITKEIKKDLTNSTERTSPKLLRKKESPPPPPPNVKKISRKKSKDSSRSSLHSPPPSPSTFPNIADASMIIRRHSSSSFSSVEGDDDNDESDKTAGKRKAGQSSAAGKKRSKRDSELEKDEKAKRNDENFTKLFLEEVADADFKFDYSKFTEYKTISVRQLDNLVQAILKPGINEKAYLTLEVLLELTQLLEKLQTDSTCNVVVVSSCASSFCHGINYKSLCIEKDQSRKTAVKKLAMAVTGYLRALANFPKILVAGVHGECVGLGVTMLPLFDMVITCDNATFSIPNAKLGCAAEGGSLLSLPHLMHNVLVSELLYASRKLAAPEALRLGMVTRVIWPAKFQQELINAVKITSSHSLQFMQSTKKQLRTRMKSQIEESLNGEVDTLMENWTSAECQKNFATYD